MMTYQRKSFSFGSVEADVLVGSEGKDIVFGFGGDDHISTGAGHDIVFAGWGNDTIFGGAGNDVIKGGFGFDTAVYEGSVTDYDVSVGRGWNGPTKVTSLTEVADAGRDKLFSVEALYFVADDYTLFINGQNNAVLAGDDAVATGEDDVLTIAAADLLANDLEFDGDIVSIVGVDALSMAGATVSFNGGNIIYNPGTTFDALSDGETATDSFTYVVDDGQGGSDTATVEITIYGTNDAPVLTASAAVPVDENTTAVDAGISATDVDSTTLTYAISGGADAPLFAIDELTGALRFLAAPDFETPLDAGGDNTYDVSVSVTDEHGATATQDIAVSVADIDEVPPLDARLNEFHYDNAGTDTGEFIEIRVNAGGDVSALVIELYNGSNGASYNTFNVAGQAMTTDGTYDYYVIDLPTNGIQNGSPDGMALSNAGTVVEFLSYEGTLTAVDGFAIGVTSTDIGVSESGSTPVGYSLQRNDDGSWNAPDLATSGAANEKVDVPTTARLNEFHYDNDGTDVGEFIEVRTNAGEDITGLTVELYNGNNGAVYNTLNVADATMISDGDYDYYVIDLPSNGIQNGSPDGIALSDGSTVVEFLSYEGTFDAVDGTAAGLTSTDIEVAETGSDPAGQSLQRNDDGTWRAPEANTAGAANDVILPPAMDALISQVQGNGASSSLVGQSVIVTAVVTHIVSNGYYLQEEDADADADASTSEGVFVFTGSAAMVDVGNLISVTGEVGEYFGMTQISNVTSTVVMATMVDAPTAAQIVLSPDAAPDYEAVEGMLVSVSSGTPDPLTIIENFNFDRYGELVISSGVQVQPTQIFDAQTEAAEIAELMQQNEDNRLILDDGNGSQNPDAFEFVPGGPGDNGNGFLDSGDDFGDEGSTIRLGAELTDTAEGVISYAFGDYRLVVTETLEIDEATNSGAREVAASDVGGTLQVASVNVLNYFSTIDGTGTSGPNGLDPRGADTLEELVRQTEKLVANITGTGAEVIALQEIENNGFGADSAAQTLVDALNVEAAATASGASYASIDPTGGTGDGFVGTDAIMAAVIYDANAVTLVNADYLVFAETSAAQTYALAEVLNAVVSAGDQVGDFDRNRPSVAATFEDNETGEIFTVVSSHFKSKGDSNLQDVVEAAQAYLDGGGADITQADIDALVADPNYDQGDGQGFWSQVRLDAATELADWIANDYSGTGVDDYLLLGDMNSYAEEDAVQYLDDDAGLVDLIDSFIGQDEAYSYVFDGQRGTLDQGFASGGLATKVSGVTEWHINADEPDLIGYDSSFTNADFYNDGVYASSDHDPLIIGLDFADPFAMA